MLIDNIVIERTAEKENGEPSVFGIFCIIVGLIILYNIIIYIMHLVKQRRLKQLIKYLEDIKSQLPDDKNNKKKARL
jgi:hypothetical protein